MTQFGNATREEIDKLLTVKLSEALDEEDTDLIIKGLVGIEVLSVKANETAIIIMTLPTNLRE